jgi:hypothetical protein
MDARPLLGPLRWLSYVVLAAMIGAIGYAAFISLLNWPGIAV